MEREPQDQEDFVNDQIDREEAKQERIENDRVEALLEAEAKRLEFVNSNGLHPKTVIIMETDKTVVFKYPYGDNERMGTIFK